MENATRQLPTLTCIVLLLNRQLEKNDLSRKITNGSCIAVKISFLGKNVVDAIMKDVTI